MKIKTMADLNAMRGETRQEPDIGKAFQAALDRQSEINSATVSALDKLVAAMSIDRPAPQVNISSPEIARVNKWRFVIKRGFGGEISEMIAEAVDGE